jgi:Protein of unknown function (DUF1566)/Bacterial Ig-like domain
MKINKFSLFVVLSLIIMGGCKEVEVPGNSPIDDYQDSVVPNVIRSIYTGSVVEVIFSEEMDSSTITNDTISVNNGTSDINGVVSYYYRKATFTPTVSLDPETDYTITVSNGVKDIANNALTVSYTYEFNANQSVTMDTTSGLMWQDNSYTTKHNWRSAMDYCDNLILAGFDDWYLPSRNELSGLYFRKSILNDYVSGSYWSSEELSTNSAWVVFFTSAGSGGIPKSAEVYVRCVRAGQ